MATLRIVIIKIFEIISFYMLRLNIVSKQLNVNNITIPFQCDFTNIIPLKFKINELWTGNNSFFRERP